MFRPICSVASLFATLSLALAQQHPPRPKPAGPSAPPQNAAAPAPPQDPAAAKAPAASPIAQNAAPIAQNAGPPPVAQNPVSTPAAVPHNGNGNDTVTLQYPNSDVQDVLHLYETLTNKRLILHNGVQGKVNIFITKPVPREDAIRIIEMNLALNGFSLVPASEDIMEVLPPGQNARIAQVPIISDEADIPEGDETVSFLFRLKYADPQELQQVLSQYMAAPGAVGAILALPKSGSIIVTQSAGVIRRLASIVNQVDVAPAEVVSEFIRLERADAQKVVDMLKDIFEKGNQPNQPGPPGAVRPIRPPVPQPGQIQAEGGGVDIGGIAALSEDTLIVGKIKISADVRTNRIHVITRPMNLPFIHKLISEFDANVEFAQPVVRQLRYVSAADMLPVIQESLTEPGGQQGGAPAAGGPNQPPQQQPQRRNPNTATNGGYSSGTSSEVGGSSGGGLNVSEELSTQAVDTTPKAVTIGNAKIIADQRANTIIILGNREVVVKVQKILDEMDVSSPQVALSTVIGELTLSKNEDFGVDYFGRHSRGLDVSGTTSNTGVPPFSGGSSSTSSSGTTTTTGGNVLDPARLLSFTQLATSAATGVNAYLAAGQSLAAVVHALDSTGRFKTISRPTVFTSNNKKAIIASGQEIPIPVNSYSVPTGTTTSFANSSSVEYKKVALQLEVVPLINSEREVSLDILQKLDSLGNSTIINGNPIPTIATRYIRTNVSAPNCSTIVLGGLITDDKRRDTSGIPLLSKIPVLGGLFRNTSRTNQRTELLVLMRPEVSLSQTDLSRLRRKAEDKSHFGPELDQDDCPGCTPEEKQLESKEITLPPPDLPAQHGD